MKKIAVITAGGIGNRMGIDTPKQFLLLAGKPLLWHCIQSFLTAFNDIDFILILPAHYLDGAEALIADLQIGHRTTIVAGGSTRFHSVQNGLKKIEEPAVIFVHDGVRCLVSPNLIKRCYEQTMQTGSAIPAVVSTDSIRLDQGGYSQSIDRNLVHIVQTPQTFLSELLLPAFEQDYCDSFTDEATVVEAAGKKVALIEGEYRNIKITRPVDLLMAEMLLAEKG
ncbi:MAG: 2-C-methyl-D-erythritol 4-phosphate cytidylyltransferase [Sphingobacteriia bacterium]|nr:MAG: 2-C-methyl-D-erythritol 4-phosphate cytidylyltransferase [Sphingobacteriia bacterium]TAG31829.1 MAG: 2-C-methyl-D-erythritol 4-phosphate cytidylyltransferase [Sphingobacteriia bacterium]